MAIKLEISADLRQAIQSLQQFSTEIDRAGGVTQDKAVKIASALDKAFQSVQKFSKANVGEVDFVAKLEEARQRIHANIDAMANEALGINEGFDKAVEPSIKSIQQLENEMNELKKKIETATSVSDIQKLSVQFGAVQKEADKLRSTFEKVSNLSIDQKFAAIVPNTLVDRVQAFGGGVRKMGVEMNNVTPAFSRFKTSSNASLLAMTNLGRVLQDAPFGFLGIANNLNPLLESFQRLQKETGSVGGTLKALGSSLLGAGGLGLALSAVQFFALGGGDALKKFASSLFGAKDAAARSAEVIKGVFQDAAKNSGEEVAKLQIFKIKLNDLNISASDRIKIAKEYNKIADDQNKIDTTQIDNLTQINRKIDEQNKLIIARAVSLSATAKLGTFSDKFVDAQLQLSQALKESGLSEEEYIKKATEFHRQRSVLLNEFQKAGAIGTKTRFSIEQDIDSLDATIKKTLGSMGLLVLDLIDTKNKAKKELDDVGASLSDLITVKGLQTKTPKPRDNKDKIQFLFDFLPFDPNGKLKAEQRAQLIDAIDKFQKEFGSIIQGANFTGNTDEIIKQAIALDLQFKAGKIKFNVETVREGIQKEFEKIKTEDLLPPIILPNLDVVEQFTKSIDENIQRHKKDITNLNSILSPTDIIENFRLQLARLGEQLPKEINTVDIFGNPITVTLDDLFDTSKIANNDALKALQDFVDKIKAKVADLKTQLQTSINDDFKNSINDAFVGIGEGIGQAIASGSNLFEAAAQSFAQALGSFVELIGKDLIKYGIIKTGLDKIIEGGIAIPGVAAIALGISAVAIGALIKASFSNLHKFSKGGIVPGSGNQDTVPALLTPGELVIPKNQVSKVQKLLKESVSFKLPQNLFGSLGLTESFNQLKKMASFQFNIPQLSIPSRTTDSIAPLSKAQFALAGTAARQIDVNVNGGWRGNDFVLGLAKVSQSQGRNFGRKPF